MLRGKRPHNPEFAYDIVRIHSLMIYTDVSAYKIVDDTKGPLLHWFLFVSKLKGGDIISTGQYVNYQLFSNLQCRLLLKKFFHSIHIDLRDTSGEKIPFVSVGITRLVLMFRKASNIHFTPKRQYKMFASGHVEIRFNSRQRGRGFGALAHVIGRSVIPFLRNFIVSAAKCVDGDLLEVAVPEDAEVISGKKKIKTDAESVGRQTLRKQLGNGRRKGSASRVIPTKTAKQISRSRRDVSTNISH